MFIKLSGLSAVGLTLMLLAAPLHASQQPPAEADALRQLEQSGSDLSKVHRFEFHVRFPTQDAAEQAAAQLEELAFKTTAERDTVNDTWVVLAVKMMYPRANDLAGLRDKLTAIAAEHAGAYEGWQARPRD